MLQRTVEYALRTVVWMAREPGRAQTSQEIAEGTQVPPRYLYRVLQKLAKGGLLSSQPGPGGGYTLAGDTDKSSLLDIVRAIGPVDRIHTCPLGLRSHKELCPLHQHLDDAYANLEQVLARVSVSEVARAPSLYPSLVEAKNLPRKRRRTGRT
jgi:Rrf2 family protein